MNIYDLQKFDKEYLIGIIIQLNNRAQELEKQLNKNSSNSSKPPSSDNFPPNKNQLKAPMQIGQNLKSFIVYLSTCHYLPYQRLTQLIKDLLNMPLSQGTAVFTP